MQNKSAVLIFTVLLALATLYTLSFNYFSSQFENEAQVQGVYEAEQLLDAGQITDAQFDATAAKEAKDFLRAKGDSAIVPVIGKTYREAKERELNLGLDLRGGMSVTLEVSIPDLVIALADYSTNEQFRAAVDQAKADRRNSNADFITLFGQAWAAQGGDVELWRIFHNMENRDLFPQKSTDDEILAILRAEAETAINNTENIIRKRIDQLGVAQPNVQKLSFSGRILVELPGIDDPARARKQLKSTANLEFWETWFNEEVAQRIADANVAAGQALSPDLYTEEAPADSGFLARSWSGPRTRCLPCCNPSAPPGPASSDTPCRRTPARSTTSSPCRPSRPPSATTSVSFGAPRVTATCPRSTPFRTRAVVARPSWTVRASSTPASAMTKSETWSAT